MNPADQKFEIFLKLDRARSVLTKALELCDAEAGCDRSEIEAALVLVDKAGSKFAYWERLRPDQAADLVPGEDAPGYVQAKWAFDHDHYVILVSQSYHRLTEWCQRYGINPVNRRVVFVTSADQAQRLRGLRLTSEDVVVEVGPYPEGVDGAVIYRMILERARPSKRSG